MDTVDKEPTLTASAERKPAPDREWMPWSFPVALFAGVGLLLLVYLGQFASLVRTQYKIVALKDKQRLLEREKVDLQLQIQQLTALERVERVASTRLKMIAPTHRQVVNLGPNAKLVQTAEKNSTVAQ